MTFKDKLVQYYQDAGVIRVCREVGGEHWEDIRGEVIYKLLNLSEEKQEQIKNVRGFLMYSCRNYGIDQIKKIKLETVPIIENIKEPELREFDILRLNRKIENDCDSPKRFFQARIFKFCQIYGVNTFSSMIRIKRNIIIEANREYKQYLKNWYENSLP